MNGVEILRICLLIRRRRPSLLFLGNQKFVHFIDGAVSIVTISKDLSTRKRDSVNMKTFIDQCFGLMGQIKDLRESLLDTTESVKKLISQKRDEAGIFFGFGFELEVGDSPKEKTIAADSTSTTFVGKCANVISTNTVVELIEFVDALTDLIQGDINKNMRNSVAKILPTEGAEVGFARTKEVPTRKFNSAESTLSKVYAEINRFGEFATGNQRAAYDVLMRNLIPSLLDITLCAATNTTVRQFRQEIGVRKNAVAFPDALKPVKDFASVANKSASDIVGCNPVLQYAGNYAKKHRSLIPKDAASNDDISHEKINYPDEQRRRIRFRTNTRSVLFGVLNVATSFYFPTYSN